MCDLPRSDPVIALVAERFRIVEEVAAKMIDADDDAVRAIDDEALASIARRDEQIAATLATSTAGLVGQVRVLQELGWGEYPDKHGERLADTIVAGIERLARGAV